MTKPKARLDAWAEAQKHFHLSDLHIQMTRELGLNPKISAGSPISAGALEVSIR